MKRIFIAVKAEAGETLLGVLSDLKRGLGDSIIKWTSPANIHITLSFLGDTEDEMIEAVNEMLHMRCGGFGKFELKLRGLGVFKSVTDPRIIWTGIEPSSDLVQLNEIILNGLKDIGIKTEERAFNPHLTLGRIKSVKDKNVLKLLLDKNKNSEIQRVPVDDVILFESILFNTGPVYKPINIINL
jgi:2'-5' RNA ligase